MRRGFCAAVRRGSRKAVTVVKIIKSCSRDVGACQSLKHILHLLNEGARSCRRSGNVGGGRWDGQIDEQAGTKIRTAYSYLRRVRRSPLRALNPWQLRTEFAARTVPERRIAA